MPSPKGSYAPKSGPLVGRTFPSYFKYQQARASMLGFSSYAEQRRITGISLVRTLIDRAIASGMSRNRAVSEVRQWYQSQGYHGRSARPGANHSRNQGSRKRAAIAWAVDNGLYDNGDDAAFDIAY